MTFTLKHKIIVNTNVPTHSGTLTQSITPCGPGDTLLDITPVQHTINYYPIIMGGNQASGWGSNVSYDYPRLDVSGGKVTASTAFHSTVNPRFYIEVNAELIATSTATCQAL
jgi:hypothetical protein